MTESNIIRTTSAHPIDTAIRISLVALLAYWSFLICKPFVVLLIWSIIIAVAIFPLFKKFETLFGEQKKLALILFTLLLLSILIVPSILLISSLIETARGLAETMQTGTLHIPPPPSNVAEWPVIGKHIFSVWTAASENLVDTLSRFKSELKVVGTWVLSTTAGTVGSVLQFIISIIIASVFMANANGANQFSKSLFIRVAGEAGKDFAEIAGATMRSVAQGVLGVAFIQALLAGIGLLLMDVPGAGLWTLGVLLLAIMQLPTILLLGPIVVYVFSVADTVPAVIFMVWSLLVGLSDNVLKPLFLGRGMDIPMLVILIGAIGGMMLHGIIGLFIGAVILAIVYKLFIQWLETRN
jgi:predicted PurR-regulated permease PerM